MLQIEEPWLALITKYAGQCGWLFRDYTVGGHLTGRLLMAWGRPICQSLEGRTRMGSIIAANDSRLCSIRAAEGA